LRHPTRHRGAPTHTSCDASEQSPPLTADSEFRVTFRSTLVSSRKVCKLAWVHHDTGELVQMDSILPTEDVKIDTFIGHQFSLKIDRKREWIITITGPGTWIVNSAGVNFEPPQDRCKQSTELYHTDSPLDRLHSINELATDSLPVRFRNLCAHDIALWFDDNAGTGGIFNGLIKPGKDMLGNSYPGHSFCFTHPESDQGCNGSLKRVVVSKMLYTHAYDDGSGAGWWPHEMQSRWNAEILANEQYHSQTGRHWLTYWPRDPPVLKMLPSGSVGSILVVRTSTPLQPAPFDMPDPGALRLQVLAQKPRAFSIEQFLSIDEVAHIVAYGVADEEAFTAAAEMKQSAASSGSTSQHAQRSSDWDPAKQDDGPFRQDGQSTELPAAIPEDSRSTWIRRDASPIIERVFTRAADLLGIDASLLTHDKNAEMMQLVHYLPGDRHESHYDWQVERKGGGATRFITLLLYLSNPILGGETTFPRAEHKVDGNHVPLIVHPRTGGAVLLYNLLQDGNTDELALLEMLPVLYGEKWLAKIRIHDSMVHE